MQLEKIKTYAMAISLSPFSNMQPADGKLYITFAIYRSRKTANGGQVSPNDLGSIHSIKCGDETPGADPIKLSQLDR
ncbi:hypothetical protein [Xanthobacter sp. KR7-225]|uniref:hypothetical protein n=1 Tax=Xanthobacter sp. KR7-225 TaxID=3156613 RepID=UPI0032B54959